MNTRADRTTGHESDPDRTDELPVLDPVAYEAAQSAVVAGASAPDAAVTSAQTVSSDLAGVFDTIRSLEASLRAKSEHTSNLEQQITRLERQLRAQEKDRADLQAQFSDLGETRDGLAADLEARGATIARLKTDLAARAEQIRSIEQQRDVVEIDKVALQDVIRARDSRIGILESEAAANVTRLTELEGLAQSHDQVGRHLKSSIGDLEAQVQSRLSDIAARDQRIAELATQLEQKEIARGDMARALERQSRKLAELDGEVARAQRQAARSLEVLQSLETRRRFHDDALFEFEQEIEIHLQQVAQLEGELTERAAEFAASEERERERDATINELRGELQNRDLALNERAAELGRLRAITQDSGGIIADLERRLKLQAADCTRLQIELAERDARLVAAQDDLRAAAEKLRQHDEEQAALRSSHEALRQQLNRRVDEITSLITSVQSEQNRAAALEAELAARMRAAAELDSRQRVQEEIAESQAHELDNWKEKWSEVAGAVGEKEARLAHLESDLRVNAAELAVRAERINTLQKTIEDQADTLTALERELRDKAESLARFEGDLRVAEDSMLRLESQLRQKTDQQAGVQRTLEEQRGQIRHLQDTLTTRDAAVARLEGELKASNEIIGNIQRDIRRLSGEELAARPAAAKVEAAAPPPAPAPVPEPELAARLFVRMDSETEVVHVINRKVTSIGRTDDNDIAIDTRYISRHHARILAGPNATVIEDLGSTNGVYVNDNRVKQRQALSDGDIVMVGKTRFRFALKASERNA
ncbi:MAG TPA: FHA domain-containing protein [Steroidobacteraceae bacterium]|nr:FHA domain-containing protein [Steroidobacteraceae bacterium]